MIEVRRIRRDEAEEFLGLLCSVFGLDVSRAKPVFYDPVLFDLNRKWALFCDGQMSSILTTTGLTFGWGRCIGIAGVATTYVCRRRGFAERLLEKVLGTAEEEGEGPAMLFAHDTTLYQRVGFRQVDEVVRGSLATTRVNPEPAPLESNEIQSCYAKWASASPDRLVRTKERWRYWSLACRVCEPFLGGYLCSEPGLVREVVSEGSADRWPVPVGSEWYGLRTVAKACEVPMKRAKSELLFMTRNVPGQPQMFMTDQF